MGKSPLILAALAKVANPALSITRVTKLGQDLNHLFDSALLTDALGNNYVIKVPLTQQAAVDLDVETQVLRFFDHSVRGRLGFKLPSQMGETRDSRGKRVVLFEYVYGAPIEVARISPSSAIATGIGIALSQIHNLPADKVRAAGLPDFTPADVVKAQLAKLDAAAVTGLVPPALLERWQDALENVSLFQFTPRVIHGALSEGDVLELDSEVSGILNWFGVQVSDPAMDFKWIAGAGNYELLDAVRLGYVSNIDGVDASLTQRAILYSELSHAEWLLYGKRIGDAEIVQEATDELNALGELAAAGELPALTATAFGSLADAAFVAEEPVSHEHLIENTSFISEDATAPIELPKPADEELF